MESSWTKVVWGQDCRRACSRATQRGLGGKLPLRFASISCHLSRPASITAELICYLLHPPRWASPCAVRLCLGRTVSSSLCRWYVAGNKEGGSESEEARSSPLLSICDLEEGGMLCIARN
ncbi:integrin alpha-3 [Platysternon megacephalum]|uniref:Integrin alpha-3 n=1 Tax=Platysternon megacephalum TaxID=55544 RepID=A0A4D9EJW7_9SAUR|nr:integrin alpha-3 [Platysternon megacephalum]